MPAGQAPLLKRRKELTREQAIKLWSQKRQAGGLAGLPGPEDAVATAATLKATNRATILIRCSRALLARVQAHRCTAMTPTRDQVLAATGGWVAVVLNVVPGLGA